MNEVAVAAPPAPVPVFVADMERDNRHLMREGRQLEMRIEMEELNGRMQSANLNEVPVPVPVPVRRGRGRPRSSFDLPLDNRLQKVDDVIDKYFPDHIAIYTEEHGLILMRDSN